MVDINAFFIGFVVINAIALALLVGWAAVELTGFFARNRQQRIARHEPFARYYSQLTLSH